MTQEKDSNDDKVCYKTVLISKPKPEGRPKNDVMNPGGGGGHMSYPGGGGYPGAGSGYGGYGSQYMSPGAGYHHHSTISPGQMSPFGPGGLGAMGVQPPTQGSPYSGGEPFNNKTPPFQQSFQRPYSPTSNFPYGSSPSLRHPQLQSHLHMAGGGGNDSPAVDLKMSSMYPGQNYSAAHQNSSPYGYNGFGHSPAHQTSSYNSPDPTIPVDNISRRHFENYYDKSSGDASPNPIDTKPSNSDNSLMSTMCNDDDKNVADDLSVRRSDNDNPNGTSRNGDRGEENNEDSDQKEFVLKSESSLIDNLDSIPYIPDIPDIKGSGEMSQRDNPENMLQRHPESDPSSPMRNRGLKRSHSPSIDAQDSESQDSYGGGPLPAQGMMGSGGGGAAHPESEFAHGINEGSGKKYL